jgi:hypothetical protein
MSDEPHGERDAVDERLRAIFPLEDAGAQALASRALNARLRPRRTWRWPPALATVVLGAVLAAWLSRPTMLSPATVPARTADVLELSASFVDGVLVVRIPGDGAVIVSPEPRDRPRDGSGIVVVEGDVR